MGTRKDAREIRRPPGEGSVAESGLKLPAGLPASPNLEGDSLATDSRDLGPNFGETDDVPEVSAAVELPKNSPQIEEPLTSISGRTMVSNLAERAFNKTREEQVTRDSISTEKAPNEAREEQVKLDSNSAGKASSEAREEQVSSKGLLEESREQDHADLKVPLFHFLAGNELKHTRRKHKKGLCKDFVTKPLSENGFNELAGSKRKLMGEWITGDHKRTELGDISNSGISAVVAVQPRRES